MTETTCCPLAVEFLETLTATGIRVGLILVIAVALTIFARRFAKKMLNRTREEDTMSGITGQRSTTLSVVLVGVVTVVIWLFAFLQALSEVGLKLGPILTAVGMLGVAIGLGGQTIARDFLTGFFILLEDQYRVGDSVDINGTSGRVEKFSLRVTSLRGVDGTLHHIPHNVIVKVSNESRGWSRAIVDIPVPVAEDLAKVNDALEKAGEDLQEDSRVGRLVVDPPSVLGVENLTESRVTVRVAISTVPGRHPRVARTYRQLVKQRFDEEGIVSAA